MLANLVKKDFLLVKKSIMAFLGISILVPLIIIILMRIFIFNGLLSMVRNIIIFSFLTKCFRRVVRWSCGWVMNLIKHGESNMIDFCARCFYLLVRCSKWER